MVEILASEIAKLTKETPNEIEKLKEQVAQFEPVMEQVRKQVEKKKEDLKALEEQERLNQERLEKLTGGTYG